MDNGENSPNQGDAQVISRRFLVGILTAVTISLLHGGSANAASDLQFSLFATHPYASQSIYNETSKNYYTGANLCAPLNGETTRTCPVGQTITDMEISNDSELVAGYGDWNSNSDTFGVQPWSRVGAMPLNVNTNTWGTMVYAGSEALGSVRKFDDGTIYTTTTDPSNRIASGQTQNNRRGFITNASGSWQFMSDKGTAVHVFDVAKDGDGNIWTFGGIDWATGGAGIVWRTTTGDDAWEEMKVETSTATASGYERNYWGAYLNGKIYTRTSSTNPSTPMRVYDTATGEWSDSDVSINSANAKYVATFDNNIIFGTSSTLTIFDGENTTTKPLGTANSFKDFTKYNGKLYVLTTSGKVFSLDSASSELELVGSVATASLSASTIAIYDDYLFVGGPNGKIWRSDTKLSDAPSIAPKLNSVSPATLSVSSTGEFIINGEDIPSGSTVKVGSVTATVDSMHSQTIHATLNMRTMRSLLTANGVSSQAFDVTVTTPLGETATLVSALTVTLAATNADANSDDSDPTTPTNPTDSKTSTTDNSSANTASATQQSAESTEKTVSLSDINQLAKTGVGSSLVTLFAGAFLLAGVVFTMTKKRKITKRRF